MEHIKVSVIVPTHNRSDKLAATLVCLRNQSRTASDYEMIVVDDGSDPPIVMPDTGDGPRCTLVRLDGFGRSTARNRGAAVAEGRLLVFLDDDMSVSRDFLSAHRRAHDEWPEALLVGAIRLPDEMGTTPFGRFRQQLEQQGIPHQRGLTSMRNLCAAGNMAIPRHIFQSLGGFDGALESGEDQDLALRHTAHGGQIAFVPEAAAIHCDSALDIRSYCRRSQWGMENMIPFCQRHADWPDNIERERVNGPVRWRREPLLHSARKVVKSVLSRRPMTEGLFFVASLLEHIAPQSKTLGRIYRIVLGVHIFQGYRKGLTRYGAPFGRPPAFATTVEDLPALRAKD
jgi:glycosyltransferase involved in cell wall biosynthesis